MYDCLHLAAWLYIAILCTTRWNRTNVGIIFEWNVLIATNVNEVSFTYQSYFNVYVNTIYPRLVGIQRIFEWLTYINLSYILKYPDYATVIIVICLNLLASVRLFTSDTKWLVLTEHASGSHVFCSQQSKVNSYKTTLHNLN